jgi:uncharacterized protein (TIGR00290 family)
VTGEQPDGARGEPDGGGGEPTRTVLSWSGGKDASLALAELRERDDAEVVELLTTVGADTDRVTMHGVRRELVERQADAVDIPLRVVELPPDPSNDEYEAAMSEVHADYEARGATGGRPGGPPTERAAGGREQGSASDGASGRDARKPRGVDRVAFADLLLEDVREYREEQLADTALDGWWPVWGRDTTAVARDFLDRGFRATVACVDDDHLDASYAGREYDAAFCRDLPESVDPCGENGEFHTFAWDGPVFREPVSVEVREVVTRDVKGSAFHYADLLPE